ncbi:hypothetical protein MASR1M48_17040 [Lactococcus petauri]
MTDFFLSPIKTERSNAVLKSPSGMDNCSDLPITRVAYGDGSQAVISVWECSSLKERIKFLFKKKITFMSYGITHPPMTLSMGDMTENLPYLSEMNK